MHYRPVERLAARGVVVAALMLFFALALGAAVDKSPTNDEPIHLTRGAALRQSGDLTLQFEHPPLSHRLIGLLLDTEPTLPVVAELSSRPSGDRPAIAREFLWASGLDVQRALFLGRLPIVWVGVLLGAAVALWTAVATRPRPVPALAVVLALYAASSNLLASAALATTDLVAAATAFAAICAWWFYCRRPGRAAWMATGILLGLALATKLTGALLIPALFVLAYVYPRRDARRPALAALGLLPVAALVVWGVYGFQVGLWRGLPVPAPAYWEAWAAVLTHVSDGHQAFFLGQRSSSGWWLYFPVTFLIKTPLAFLGLLAIAPLWIARDRAARRVAAFTLLPVVLLLAAAVVSRLNIGYRHILPALPFLLVTIGLGVPGLVSRRGGRWAAALAVVWAVVAALWVHPHHLAYFSELVGGAGQGYRYLSDSNLDWGQDLKGLARYAASAGGDLHVSYSGAAEPAYYGLDQPALAGPDGAGSPAFHPANPAPGRYAISAGHVQGLLPEADLFDWFRRRAPDGAIGYSILLYDVAEARPGDWIAQCASPAPLLSPAAAEGLVGAAGARHLLFDCASAWVFPDEGAPGWLILPPRDEPWWIEEHPAATPTLVYRHGASEFGPAYEVYYWPGETDPAALLNEASDAAGGGPAELRGYAADGREWLTLWRVAAATGEPLSVLAHLYTGDSPPQVADGLGFAADQWRPGDWFIQRHAFPAPGETLETGLYNYVTLEPATERVRLPP